MTTATLPADAVILGDRYVCRDSDWSHLLTDRWSAQPGGTRPALCGLARRTWRAIHTMVDPSLYRPCPDCDEAAGLTAPDPEPQWLVPDPQQARGRGPVRAPEGPSVVAEQLDPQQAHAAMPTHHRIWRGRNVFGFELSPEARAYRPRRYRQRIPETQ